MKDSPALNMIKNTREKGGIGRQAKRLETASGNTGIAMAWIAEFFHLETGCTTPSASTSGRDLAIEAFGAQVALLAGRKRRRDGAEEKGTGDQYFLLNQPALPAEGLAQDKKIPFRVNAFPDCYQKAVSFDSLLRQNSKTKLISNERTVFNSMLDFFVGNFLCAR